MEELLAFFVSVGDDFGRFWPALLFIGSLFGAIATTAVLPILQQDESFKQIRNWAVKPGIAARYQDLITYGLRVAARFYGARLWLSWRGYNACFVIALVYPFTLWLSAWILDGPRAVAGLQALDESIPTSEHRAVRAERSDWA